MHCLCPSETQHSYPVPKPCMGCPSRAIHSRYGPLSYCDRFKAGDAHQGERGVGCNQGRHCSGERSGLLGCLLLQAGLAAQSTYMEECGVREGCCVSLQARIELCNLPTHRARQRGAARQLWNTPATRQKYCQPMEGADCCWHAKEKRCSPGRLATTAR
jgi:hypothetical protein